MSTTDQILLLTCPQCGHQVLVAEHEINCAIFRHAVLKVTGVQIHPHTPKDKCEEYLNRGLIYGCGKPFRVRKNPTTNQYEALVCDYL